MKSSPVSPGKLYASKTGGKRERLFLVLAMRLSGQRQQSLGGFEGATPVDHATVSEAVGGKWSKVGEILNVPLSAFTGEAPSFRFVPRRGPPITYMPGKADLPTARVNRSDATLIGSGGARKQMRFSEDAVQALNRIRTARQQTTVEKLDDTKVVHALILEEDKRLSTGKK